VGCLFCNLTNGEILESSLGVTIAGVSSDKRECPGAADHQSQFAGGDLVRFLGLIFHPRVDGDPVRFPSFASIVREGLFKTARIRSTARYHESNIDGPAIQCFLAEKLAESILELADCRRV
jgi:hypothetical protein